MAGLADDNGEFAFIVHGIASQPAGQHDGIARILAGTAGLHEDHGIFGDWLSPLLGVFAVIESNADDVGGLERRQQFGDLCRFPGITEVAEQLPFQPGGLATSVSGTEVNGSGGIAVTDDLHGAFRWEKMRTETLTDLRRPPSINGTAVTARQPAATMGEATCDRNPHDLSGPVAGTNRKPAPSGTGDRANCPTDLIGRGCLKPPDWAGKQAIGGPICHPEAAW